jgi:predicted regulator of amino acid metabolism with ACT domain
LNLTVFMIARIIGGLSKANVAIILAIVSDTTTENERNRAMVTYDEICLSIEIEKLLDDTGRARFVLSVLIDR